MGHRKTTSLDSTCAHPVQQHKCLHGKNSHSFVSDRHTTHSLSLSRDKWEVGTGGGGDDGAVVVVEVATGGEVTCCGRV